VNHEQKNTDQFAFLYGFLQYYHKTSITVVEKRTLILRVLFKLQNSVIFSTQYVANLREVNNLSV